MKSSTHIQTSRLSLSQLLDTYRHSSSYEDLQHLHAAILDFGDDVSRYHTLVAPWQLNPTFLAGVFETPLAYSTLHKAIPSLTPFAVLYRKAFPSKRQPRHWISTLRKALDIPAVCVHLIEVYVFFWLGLFSPTAKCNTSLSIEHHRELVLLWRTRRDWQKHRDLLQSFYCSPETNKISICAVAEAFAFVLAPFESAMASVSATWSTQYLPRLRIVCDSLRQSFGSRLRPEQRIELDRFNSCMAAMGPLCTFPVCFWETALAHVRGDLVSAVPDSLERPALLIAFVTHPHALDAWEREFLHRNCVPSSIQLEVLSAVRFLYTFAPRVDEDEGFRRIVPLLVQLILGFYLSRFGPSVLRSSLVKQFAAHRAELSRLAWRWNALFATYRVAWSETHEIRLQRRVAHRIRCLQLQESTKLAVRRIQYCTNCGAIHTHHNGVPPLKANSSVELYRAEMTIGCDMSAFSLLSGASFCARSGSKMALHCGETQAVCFYLRGWTYINARCFFMCVRCGMQSIWDSSVCFVTLRDGPLCSRCTFCEMIGVDDEYTETMAWAKPKKTKRKTSKKR